MSEETETKPKPMVPINGKPMLWHIMSIYARFGYKDFTVATGYKSEIIDDWVMTLREDWNVQTLFTGDESQTGGRLKQVIESNEDTLFMATYGDGLGNIDIGSLIQFHLNHGKLATLTAVRPPARFGYIRAKDSLVTNFGEKSQLDNGWINGGFFVLHREVSGLIRDNREAFEIGALPRLVHRQQLMAFYHEGFWMPMDTRSEMNVLSDLARETPPPWHK